MKKQYLLLAAVTIDGKIAKNSGHLSTRWTSDEDKNHLHAILDKSDLVVVGNNTYKTAYRPLRQRNCVVFTRSVKTTAQKNAKCLYLNPSAVDIKKWLAQSPYKKIAILGGTATYNLFLEKKLISDIYLTIEPVIFGTGLGLFDTNLKNFQRFKLLSIKKLNRRGSILLHYTA
ncbi:MAG: hypothetical protein A3J93_04790 [Candidatus Magasanikbacteria bacterium RIFOXYC2_FULL_42_28]|uniref:Bacterial bifunctional deaminase-reductase C-terminal domain-containing protein n=1 Tax=Candidatus Magasanikbacteria bacterium RIFOXYC2_FULL_42_28 TaxID=1798704 RepID=A0A1F6NWM6_9BACT|nr:MAG: hypothetical protein A3J93_04790 [Candidatus Magasanikbacteria bacterium RIFOXYC2_FULL_42_28]